MDNFYKWKNHTLILNVYVQPGACINEVVGIFDNHLKIRIRALAENNRANKQLKKFLAELFGVPEKSIELTRGNSGRRKCMQINNPQKLPPMIH